MIEKVIMTDNVTNDLATKLLAQENLMINRAPVRTASFDVKNRILTLPQWKDITPDVENMLKAHEVGHALYTDESLMLDYRAKYKDVPFSYFNVIEDARIERIMKKNYPGLRRVFTSGYRQLMDRDFFDIASRDVNNLALIDRINLYTKVGAILDIKFTPAEKYLVNRVERNESTQEVLTLARAVFEYSKRDSLRLRSNRDERDIADFLGDMFNSGYEGYDDNDWDEGGPSDEEENSSRGAGNTATDSGQIEFSEQDESYMAPVTAGALEKNLSESADTTTVYQYLQLEDTKQPHFDYVRVGYKTVLSDLSYLLDSAKRSEYSHLYKTASDEYDVFKAETNRVVSYLIKEFEMKKAATAYKRQHISKTGVLDTAKLASYKIREDLFRQVTITKDGQKHGMVFTIDWSGSMDGYLLETVKQLISLVTFCYRTKIPFEVYAFSDQTGHLTYDQRAATLSVPPIIKPNTLRMSGMFLHMLEFFNHKMTLSEFNRACRNLYMISQNHLLRDGNRVDNYSIGSKYQLNGTPLNPAMVWLYNYLGEFKRNNQVEKLTLIKLTDGDGGGLTTMYDETGVEAYISERKYGTLDNNYKMVTVVTYLQDNVTKKVYRYDRNNTTNVICKMIEDRHDCAVVGYHVTGRGRRELTYNLEVYGHRDPVVCYDMAMAIRKGFNDEQFYALPLFGHTQMFMIPNNIKIEDGELEQNISTLTSNQIAKKFGKLMGNKRTSRVMLTKFIEAIA